MNALLKQFRIIGWLEGISYLMLFGISMPLKYMMEMGTPNKVIGIIHGVLFMVYVIYVYLLRSRASWSLKVTFLALLASILPFGTFWFDVRYVKPQLAGSAIEETNDSYS